MIQYWNRKTQQLESELVFGDTGVKALYGNSLGYAATDLFFSKKLVSQLMGSWQNTSWSAQKIPQFIETFQIPMMEYEDTTYKCFNDFFIRKFKSGRRPFPQVDNEMGAFAEARYFAFPSMAQKEIPVKGVYISAPELLTGSKYAALFSDGPCLLARLCPVDYHRFHFPDDGKCVESFSVPGKLHSVNPLALQRNKKIFLENERQVSILESKHFGKLAYVEVGALGVGKIVQTGGATFSRGDEKGYFLFGGSTVIVLGERGAWEPTPDLLANSAKGLETLVQLGSPIAIRR